MMHGFRQCEDDAADVEAELRHARVPAAGAGPDQPPGRAAERHAGEDTEPLRHGDLAPLVLHRGPGHHPREVTPCTSIHTSTI